MDQNYINDKISQFTKNAEKTGLIKDVNSHNIYYIQTEDMDGNITSEAYCVNLMTVEGLKSFICGYNSSSYSSSNSYIRLGSGESVGIEDTTLQTVSFNIDLGRPVTPAGSNTSIWYDTTKNILYTRYHYLSGELGYNVPDVVSDVTLNQIGIIVGSRHDGIDPGYQPQGLCTKSWIYDDQGHQTTITKHINEKMTIYVYLTFGVETSAFVSHFNAGEYIYFHPNMLARRADYATSYYRTIAADYMGWSGGYVLSSGWRYDVTSYDAETKRMNPGYSAANIDNILLESKYQYVSKQTESPNNGNGFQANNGDNFFAYKYIKNSTPETIEAYNVRTNTPDSNSIANAFGGWRYAYNVDGNLLIQEAIRDRDNLYMLDHKGVIPATDFHMTGSYMYNHSTKEWDIQDSFVDAPYTDYTKHFWQSISATLPSITGAHDPDDAAKVTYAIYFNPRNDILKPFSDDPNKQRHIPITKMTLSTQRLMYATNEWWDPSTYVQIDDLNNIPTSLQTKDYYIASGGSAGYINATRDQSVHTIDCGGPYYSVLVKEPSDWSTNYTSYFIKNGNTYEEVTGDTAPTFTPNVYYEETFKFEQILPRQDNEFEINFKDFAYDLLVEEPSDWASNYTSYYTKSGDVYSPVTGESAPEFITNTYYESCWLINKRLDPSNGGTGTISSANGWVCFKKYLRVPICLSNIVSFKHNNIFDKNMSVFFYNKDCSTYRSYYNASCLGYEEISQNTVVTPDDVSIRYAAAAYVRIALHISTSAITESSLPTNTDDIKLIFNRGNFAVQQTFGPICKLLRSNTNNWIALPDRILYPDEVGGPVEVPFLPVDTPYIISGKNAETHDTFIPETATSNVRFATDDKLIIPDVSYTQIYAYSTSDWTRTYCGFWPYNNRLRIFDVGSDPTQITHTDIILNFTDWDNDNSYMYGVTHFAVSKIWMFSKVDSTHAYLAVHNNHSSSKSYNEMIILKLYDNDVQNSQIKLTDVAAPYLIEGTSYVCYIVRNSTPQTFVVYDIESEAIIRTFESPAGYTTDGSTLSGVGDDIYFMAKDINNSYTTFRYSISTGGNPENLNRKDMGLYNPRNVFLDRRNVFANRCDFDVTITKSSIYDDNSFPENIQYKDILITLAHFSTSREWYNTSYPKYDTLIYRSGNSDAKCLFNGETSIINNRYGYGASNETWYWSASGVRFAQSQIQESENGKHLLLLSTSMYYGYHSYVGRPIVIDIGAQIDDVNNSAQGYQPLSLANDVANGITEYHNMIYTYYNDGSLCRRELGRFLAHKVTGSTYTITTYNNPKYFSGNTSLHFTFGIDANET